MNLLLIDNGAQLIGNFYGMRWYTDDSFITTGKNKFIEPMANIPSYMNSLRYFPQADFFLELTLPMYGLMGNDTALMLVNRTNFGVDDQIIRPWPSQACEEVLGRIWIPKSLPDYSSHEFPRAEGCATIVYFVFHFLDTNMSLYWDSNVNRSMEIFIDGVSRNVIKLDSLHKGQVVSLYPVTVKVQDMINLFIDSGAQDTGNFYGMRWWTDESFITTGKTKLLEPKINIPGYMYTLRYFPKGNQNCYKLPLSPNRKFLIRAGFYYGGYDGKFNPPVFNLTLGGEYWATVHTSLGDEPIYHEAIYAPKTKSLSVCLVQIKSGDIPFISSLEASYFWDREQPKYALMGNNTVLKLVNRTNFGDYDQNIGPWPVDSCEEFYGRIWIPKSMPDYPNNNFNSYKCISTSYDNEPPSSVMTTSISAPNPSSSITFSVDFMTDTPQTAYFVFYFLDPNIFYNSTDTRMMEIFIDGVSKNIIELDYFDKGQVLSLYPMTVKGTAKVRISPYNASTMPPILSGMEVFTASELVEQQTSSGIKLFYYPNKKYDKSGSSTSYHENKPPSSVKETSISAPNSSSLITFPINFRTDTPQTAYFVFYFYDSTILANSTDARMMEIFINGVSKNVTQLNFYRNAQVVSVYPVAVKGIANVTISPCKLQEFHIATYT
ncbi:Malectin-like domain [Dillenia turbinata]|uniref:Malectin-like domain n=1 Tax=Dillenia turbinata TaxID=194707 RepID=A0AAN8VP90_9MAGN